MISRREPSVLNSLVKPVRHPAIELFKQDLVQMIRCGVPMASDFRIRRTLCLERFYLFGIRYLDLNLENAQN